MDDPDDWLTCRPSLGSTGSMRSARRVSTAGGRPVLVGGRARSAAYHQVVADRYAAARG